MTTTTQKTARTGDGSTGSSSALAARWSDLPDDILGNIRSKITSLCDRVRLAAVCRPWRATTARLPALPVAPLLLMSPRTKTGGVKQLCGGGSDDSWAMRVPDKVADKCIMGSHEGGWVAVFDYGTRELMLVNLFSGVEAGVCYPWPEDPGVNFLWNPICHVIFSDEPTSSKGCILAIITNGLRNIALCKVGCHSGWTKHGWDKKMFIDIAFCNGDLYGLVHPLKELVRFKIGMEENGSSMVISTHQLAIQRNHIPTVAYYDSCYIVELHGKPSMAIRTRWLSNREPFFKVFELVDADIGEAYQHKWVEMSSFGEYSLFLGPARCKAVHVRSELHGFERNHIYHSKATNSVKSNLCGDEVYSLKLDDGRLMYRREDQNIGDGFGRTGYYTTGCGNASMWLDPPNL